MYSSFVSLETFVVSATEISVVLTALVSEISVEVLSVVTAVVVVEEVVVIDVVADVEVPAVV